RFFTSRSDNAHNSSVVSIDAPIIHDLRIMVTHGFRNQTNAPAKNHNCNAKGREETHSPQQTISTNRSDSGRGQWSLIQKDRFAGSVISRVPLGRPLTGALASSRAPPSPARISGEPTGTASGLAALGDRHADRTAGGGRAVGLETLVLGIHPATIDEQRIAQGPRAIAVERVDN